MIIPAKAIPVYTFDEGIKTLNTASLAEIDRLAEEFAMGQFEVAGGNNRGEFYKLLNEKLDQIPKIKEHLYNASRMIKRNKKKEF